MPSPNTPAILERLVHDDAVSPRVARLVEAAMAGDAELTEALQADHAEAPTPPERTPGSGGAPRAFLRRLEIEGFRGIGPASTLEVEPGPGLTLVVGRNGSGKSSFVEGLELLLTGDSTRWSGKKPIQQWRSGWRNLHAHSRVALSGTFTVEGSGLPVTVSRRWGEDGSLGDGELTTRRGPESLEGGLDALGWASAITASRPFLSYNDISRAWDAGPSQLFDALMDMLGLDDVRSALGRLATARKDMEKRKKACSADARALGGRLRQSADPRAARCLAQVEARSPDLALLDAAMDAEDPQTDDALPSLRRLATLAAPDETEVLTLVEALDHAVATRDAAAGTRDAHALATADLLEHAVRWHAEVDVEVCPVCGTTGVLDGSWREEARAQARTLKEAAREAAAARKRVDLAKQRAVRMARGVVAPEGGLGSVDAAREAHAAWSDLPDDPGALARHLERTWGALDRTYQRCREEASTRLETLQADWRPLRRDLEKWREQRARVDTEADALAAVRTAEAWLKEADEALRAAAFAPIAEHAKRTWSHLRAQSNVDIADVTLQGSATRRRVSLDVTVDGTEGVALGVMSQGELHALALSLFLPRLLRADSPFGFLLIDDPVQAMDPAKVDGLATVLHEAARTHQVIVFTHDPRLPAAVRRLGFDATVVEVRRNPTSHVELRVGQAPVAQYLADAYHLSDHRSEVGDAAVRHVVPGLCRSAVEAALTSRIWREQLARGVDHADIAERISESGGLHALATLAMFGNRSRGKDLFKRLRNQGADVDVFVQLKRHAHSPLPDHVDVRGFIHEVKTLTEAVLR